MSKQLPLDRALLDGAGGSLTGLLEHVRGLMSHEGWTANRLYDLMYPEAAAARKVERSARAVGAASRGVQEQQGGRSKPPVSRETFYSWFRGGAPAPSGRLLECVPAFVEVFAAGESRQGKRILAQELYARAGILEPDLNSAVIMQSAVREMARQVRVARRALGETQLAGASEALVVDRLLRSGLDYEMRVWPVVRGLAFPMHLRSWIGLRPIESDHRRRRRATRELENLEPEQRRRYIRGSVITDPLWRSLGLHWRDEPPLEWPRDYPSELIIEMPVDEKNQSPGPDPWRFDSEQQRMLILSGLWGHGETLASIIAGALDWGTEDVRYQGFTEEAASDREAFITQQLDGLDSYAWAIAEDSSTLTALQERIVEAAGRHLVVLVTYGERVASKAADAWQSNKRSIRQSQGAAAKAAVEVNRTHPIVHVAYADEDVTDRSGEVDVNLFIDHVRYSAAEVLVILKEWDSPRINQWKKPERFEDLRRATTEIRLPLRKSTVRWHEPGTFKRI